MCTTACGYIGSITRCCRDSILNGDDCRADSQMAGDVCRVGSNYCLPHLMCVEIAGGYGTCQPYPSPPPPPNPPPPSPPWLDDLCIYDSDCPFSRPCSFLQYDAYQGGSVQIWYVIITQEIDVVLLQMR